MQRPCGGNEWGLFEGQCQDQSGRRKERSGSLAEVRPDRPPPARACQVGHARGLPRCLGEMGIRYRKFPLLFFVLLSSLRTKASLAASYKVISAKGLWPKAIKSDLNRVIIHA